MQARSEKRSAKKSKQKQAMAKKSKQKKPEQPQSKPERCPRAAQPNPKSAQEHPKSTQEHPKSTPEHPQSTPRQPKNTQKRPKNTPKTSKSSKITPRRPQVDPQAPPELPKGHFIDFCSPKSSPNGAKNEPKSFKNRCKIEVEKRLLQKLIFYYVWQVWGVILEPKSSQNRPREAPSPKTQNPPKPLYLLCFFKVWASKKQHKSIPSHSNIRTRNRLPKNTPTI